MSAELGLKHMHVSTKGMTLAAMELSSSWQT
jgi:hypothetical protein